MTMKTLLSLARISNIPTVWMNIITAAVLTTQNDTLSWGAVGILCAGISCLYCGGMSFNDYCDRRWDAVHQPFRPIPAGKVRATTVAGLSLVLFSSGLLLLWFVPYRHGFVAALVLLFTIIAYDYFHKAHAANVLLMALARFQVFVITGLALTADWVSFFFVAGDLFLAAGALVLAAGALQFFYTLLVTLVARYEHVRGQPYSFPLIPRMLAGMALLDGAVLAVLVHPLWLLVGAVGAILTRFAQRYVRGD